MKSCKLKSGLTLVEMLIVVAIIAILITMVISIAARFDSRAKEQLTESTIAILNAALGEFKDYGYSYRYPDYANFGFPLDCNDYFFDDGSNFDLETTLRNALDAETVSIGDGAHDPNYSGSEMLYFFLSRVPASRKILERIDRSLITNEGSDKQEMNIEITFASGDIKTYPLFRIIDPWGKTLHYDYYDKADPGPDEKRTFPLITSAGPDEIFGTDDDVTSK